MLSLLCVHFCACACHKGLFCFILVQQQHRTNTPPCCLQVVPISRPDLPSKLPPHRNSRAEPRPGRLTFYSLCAKTDTRAANGGRLQNVPVWISVRGLQLKSAHCFCRKRLPCLEEVTSKIPCKNETLC